MQKDIFFTPFIVLHVERLTGLGLASVSQNFGQWRGFRENNTTNHQSEKRRGNRGHWLCAGFNGAFFCQVACLSAVVAVSLAGFTALHSNVTSLTTPVTFHLITGFLDVAKPTTGVALLLIGMITVAGHVASFAAGVAELLSLLFGLLAIPGNVATPVAVVARILSLVTVPGHVSWVSTPIAEELCSDTDRLVCKRLKKSSLKV